MFKVLAVEDLGGARVSVRDCVRLMNGRAGMKRVEYVSSREKYFSSFFLKGSFLLGYPDFLVYMDAVFGARCGVDRVISSEMKKLGRSTDGLMICGGIKTILVAPGDVQESLMHHDVVFHSGKRFRNSHSTVIFLSDESWFEGGDLNYFDKDTGEWKQHEYVRGVPFTFDNKEESHGATPVKLKSRTVARERGVLVLQYVHKSELE